MSNINQDNSKKSVVIHSDIPENKLLDPTEQEKAISILAYNPDTAMKVAKAISEIKLASNSKALEIDRQAKTRQMGIIGLNIIAVLGLLSGVSLAILEVEVFTTVMCFGISTLCVGSSAVSSTGNNLRAEEYSRMLQGLSQDTCKKVQDSS